MPVFGRSHPIRARVGRPPIPVAAQDFTGSVGLSGSGTLSFAGTPAIPGSAALSGSGTLTAAAPLTDITFTAGTPFQPTASVTSGTISLPSGLTNGDYTFLYCTLNATTGVITGPAGWSTALASVQSTASTSHVVAIYYKKWVSGDTDPTVTCTSGRLAVLPVKVSGADGTNPLEGSVGSTSQGAATTSVDAPSQTASTATKLVTMHSGRSASANVFITWTGNAGMTEIGEAGGQSTTQTNASLGVYSESITAGATGTRTATASTTATGSRGVSMLFVGASGPPAVVANFSGTGTLGLSGVVGGASPTLSVRVNGIGGYVSTKTLNATSVRLKVGTDTGVTANTFFTSAQTPNAQGYSQHQATGLTAGTTYYYRVAMTDSGAVETLDSNATVGKFVAPPTGQTSFAFNFSSCCSGTDSNAMTAIANRGDPLFFHRGDLWYADASGTDLANYRTKMSDKLAQPNHQKVFATMSMAYSPSDHDGSMNNNGNAGTDPTALANFNTAYREMIPTPTLPTGGHYYSFMWGRVLFVNLDTRSFTSDPAVTDNSSKTLLGATQKQWVKDEITNTSAKVIVLMGDAVWTGSASAGDDAWLGYTTERTELANHIVASKKNVCYLAGDAHSLCADNGTNSAGGIRTYGGSPLNTSASLKGGPWSAGTYPTSAGANVEQYARIVVTDNGSDIVFDFTGYSSDDTSRLTMTTTYATGSVGLSGSGTLTVPTLTPAITGAAALSGSGTLSVTPAGFSGSAGLSGSGTLSFAGTPQFVQTANFSGSGTLSFAGAPKPIQTANFSGSGTLTGAQQAVAVSGAAALSGSGTLTAPTRTPSITGTAALSGSGTLSFAGVPAIPGVATLSGSGSLTFPTQVPSILGSVALSGSGTLNATPAGAFTGSVALSGAGTLSTAAVVAVSGSAALSGSGTLTLAGMPSVARTAALSGSGTLSLVGLLVSIGSVALSGAGTLTIPTRVPAISGALALNGSGTLTAPTRTPAVSGSVALNGSGLLSLGPLPGLRGTAALNGSGLLTLSGFVPTGGRDPGDAFVVIGGVEVPMQLKAVVGGVLVPTTWAFA